MVLAKSLDEYKIIAALLLDVHSSRSEVFDRRALRLTTQKVEKRMQEEGIGFLTKSLPRLGRLLDRALTGDITFDSSVCRFERIGNGSKLPIFMGEFFKRVFSADGKVLPVPCVDSITVLRQLLFSFGKYELPYTKTQEQSVIQKFIQTEEDVSSVDRHFEHIAHRADANVFFGRRRTYADPNSDIICRARVLLQRTFAQFDPLDIYPRHGPGAVSTKEKLWGKYFWSIISPRIIRTYPLDTYFCASAGHVCDKFREFDSLKLDESLARVVLVPKDSRGPRLISCEPLVFQWIQQGLGRAIVQHVEQHPLTKGFVNFTDQQPNRQKALSGSLDGSVATLDLNEASDRISVGLVRLLFPEPLLSALLNSRSLGTQLPDGSNLLLHKYAPMGSALCFPVLALTVWALLRAGADDADTRKGIFVYGDDVIVPTAYAANAMSILESFGLKINRDKSCTSGFFRESCGMDAFLGVDVTPVRFRTVWSITPSPESYTSWVAYANEMYKRKYYNVYDYIVEKLFTLYGSIPSVDMNLSCPSLVEVPQNRLPTRRRVNRSLQKLEYHVLDVRSRSLVKELDGWAMLLRYFSESQAKSSLLRSKAKWENSHPAGDIHPFSVRRYTKRKASLLARRWR